MNTTLPGLSTPSGATNALKRLCNRNVLYCNAKFSSKHRISISPSAVTTTPSTPSTLTTSSPTTDPDQLKREGSYETPLVQLQASKEDQEQPSIAAILPDADLSTTADVAIVGCGPAGLALAAELANRGMNVYLIGPDVPFVNNYGVWLDEFKELGLENCLDYIWNDAICYFRERKEVRVGRAYGRVNRKFLRDELLKRCAAAGVKYVVGEVETIDSPPKTAESWSPSVLKLKDDSSKEIKSKLVTLASGAAAGRFLKYEENAPSVAAQTAYGIEAEVEGYNESYDSNAMLFMDFRRHHSGLWPGTGVKQMPGQHPNGAEGLWGTEKEIPSFLYAMPLGGNRVFLEETCLVAKPALPFAVLKRRLIRRCEALGMKVKDIHEEEWSYIPTGGALPESDQAITAFGAAANLVHPATGYSIARSLREAPAMAAAIVTALNEQPNSLAASQFVWDALWTQEKRRQASFHVFGMELLCKLDLNNTADFFTTFFALPNSFWRGFLASKLSSVDLLGFAGLTFVLAPWNIKAQLVGHLMTDPAGKYLYNVYMGHNRKESTAAAGVALALMLATVAAAAAEHGNFISI